MNQVTREQKDRVMKTLAVLGFLAVVIFGVWLAVQVVGLIPQAFTSLASIADSIYNYEEPTELTVTTDQSTANAGEAFLVSWEPIPFAGTYTFSYACTEGVSVDVRDAADDVNDVPCGEAVTLDGETTELEVTVSSERQRFIDVPYTISFFEEGAEESLFSSQNMITVVNASIPEGDVTESGEDAETEEEETETPEEEEPADDTEMDESDEESAEEPSTPIAEQPEYVEEVVYEVPVSDPNGYTDLSVRLVAIGELDDNGNFRPRSNIDSDSRGAFQFEVQNEGTKTSDEWDFEATLTSGEDYNADTQEPLKPAERVLFTLGFDNVGDEGIAGISVTVRGGNDIDMSNNSFEWAVSIVE